MKKEIKITAEDVIKEAYTRQEAHAILNRMADLLLITEEKKPLARKGIRIEEVKGKQCIILPMVENGEFALYPHYSKLPLINKDRVGDYAAKGMTEIEAIYDRDCTLRTDELIAVDSPAAKWVREVGFDLPTLGMVLSMVRHADEINELSKQIGGDVFNKTSDRWSCCRCYSNYAWLYNVNGITISNFFYDGFTVSAVSAFNS